MRKEAYENGNKIGYAQTSAMLTGLNNRHQSYRTINQGSNIRIMGRYIKLAKLGLVKIRQSMEAGKINNVTIECTPTGKYFAVLNVEFEPQSRQNRGGCIGIDVGIKDFYSDSNGNVVSNPRYLAMKRLQIRDMIFYKSSQRC